VESRSDNRGELVVHTRQLARGNHGIVPHMHGQRIVLRAHVVPTALAAKLTLTTQWQRQVVCVGVAAPKMVHGKQDSALADATRGGSVHVVLATVVERVGRAALPVSLAKLA